MPRSKSARPAAPARAKVGIIVAGMHRSGTSAATRVINLHGADIASDLMPPAPGNNEMGFWESETVRTIHDRLLQALDSSWDDPMPLPEHWIDGAAAQLARRELGEELHKQFADSALFVVKDPRVTRLLPLWLNIFDELAVKPIVVIPFRNPWEIALSLQRRDQLPLAMSMLMCLRDNMDVERASRGKPRLFVHYPDLLTDWRAFSKRLVEIAKPHLKPPGAKAQAEIAKFLNSKHNHNPSSHDDLTGNSIVARSVVAMYDHMLEAAATHDERSITAAFDALDRAVAEATRLYAGLVGARDSANRRLARALAVVEARSRDSGAAVETHAAESGRLTGELASVQGQLLEAKNAQTIANARLAGELTALQAQLRDSRQEIERQTGANVRLNGELASAQGRLREAGKAIETQAGEIERLGGSLAAVQAQLREAGKAADVQAAENARLRAELASVSGQLGDLGKTIETQAADIAKINGETAAATAGMTEMAAALQAASQSASAEIARLGAAEAAARAEMFRLDAAAATARAEISRLSSADEASRGEIARLHAAEAAARAEASDFDARLKSRTAETARLGEEAARWRTRTLHLEAVTAAQTARLDAISGSTSWRITAPLRWIGMRLRRSAS